MKNSLHLEGAASEPIWLMADGEEPHVIGIRLDCGDAGVVYVTREQAADLAQQLSHLLNQLGGAQGSSPSHGETLQGLWNHWDAKEWAKPSPEVVEPVAIAFAEYVLRTRSISAGRAQGSSVSATPDPELCDNQNNQ